jgi:uncharacterized protein DUF5715
MTPGSLLVALLAGGAVVAPISSLSPSLRGSGASVARMYIYAVRGRLPFYDTGAEIRRAVRQGELVRLNGDGYEVHRVSFPYVRTSTRTFVNRLSRQYTAACGETLVVTSGVRPESRQPANSSARSVHPTGMAVDLRKPDGRCLTWLRETLLDLEAAGVIEATEERHPAHFHIAVYEGPYRRYLQRTAAPSITRNPRGAGASSADR